MTQFVLDSGIEEFEDQYQGERIFLIGNGPSLDDTPLHKLSSEYSLAMNRINKIYDETEWRPSFYYVSQPPSHPEGPHKGERDYIQQNIALNIPCFLRSGYSQYDAENVHYMNVFYLHREPLFDDLSHGTVERMSVQALREFWSEDPSQLLYHYHSMYGAMQLIEYMGFEEIYLLGCDLGFKYLDPHMIFDSGMDPNRYQGPISSYLRTASEQGTLGRSFVNGVALKAIRNQYMSDFLNRFLSNSDSYFSSDYTERFRVHDGPRVNQEITKSHVIAQRICSSDGVGIYNATLGGELEVYERVDLEALI
jgi:hypothetical protein